jgi:hypothetical protein
LSAIVATLPARKRRSHGNYGKRHAGGFPADFRRIAPNVVDLRSSIDGDPVDDVGRTTLADA